MIYVIMGKNGSGKSAYLSYIVKDSLENNIPVWSNLPFSGSYVLTREDIFNANISHGRVLFDEAAIQYNSKKWQKFTDNDILFFSLHRHLDLDIYLAAVTWERLDIQIRELMHKVIMVKPSMFSPVFTAYDEYDVNVKVENGKVSEKLEKLNTLTNYKFTWESIELYDTKYLPKKLEEKSFEIWK